MTQSPPTSALVIYQRLLRYLIPHWYLFLLGVVGYAIFGVSQAHLASIMGDLVDAINNKNEDARYIIPLTVIGVSIYRAFGSFIGDYGFARVAYGIVHRLRLDLFNKLTAMPNDYFDHHSSGEMISRITFNVMQVTQAVTDALKVLIREGLTILALLGFLVWINWQITLIFFAITPVVIFLASIMGQRLRKISSRIQVSMGDITHICSEVVNNIKVVRIFSGEQYEKQRFYDASENNFKQNMKAAITAALGTPIIHNIVAIGLAIIMFLTLTFLQAETPGDFIAYLTAAGLIPKSARQLAVVINKIQKGVAAADSIFEQLDLEPEKDVGEYSTDRVKGKIVYRDVSFTYSAANDLVLDNISFNITPGKTIAFVGRSGSGKTTLISLLPRFYSEFSGEILLDDVPIKDYQINALRNQLSFVGQGVTLFNDTIANNIAYGALAGVDREKVIAVAKKAHAWEFISKLPDGLDTVIGEDGARLSGGQRQRLAIARALLKDAPVLILDEATSALDNESERKIQQALNEIMKNRTTLVIAHRLSTIENADNIIVMDAGKIIEQGSHSELLKKQGYYAQLHSNKFES